MFYKIINIVKNNYHHNFKYTKTTITTKELEIIKIFIKLGVIKTVTKLENNLYIIHFNYIKNQKTFFNIKNLYKPSNKKYIKYYTLRDLTVNKNYLLILSTNQGVITSVEAVKKKIGGLLIAKIWN